MAEVGSKRKQNSLDESNKKRKDDTAEEDNRALCKYGKTCYQKNTFHLQKFRHPHRFEDSSAEQKDEVSPEPMSTNMSPLGSESSKQDTAGNKNPEKNDSIEDPAVTHSPDESATVDEELLPPSPSDVHENIKQKFLVEMPPDFFSLWKFCCSLHEENPICALKETLGLELVGPFELMDLTKTVPNCRELSYYLNHWRFYYDPPEFQSVIVGDLTSGYHIGYFRDDPKEMPVFAASNTESKGCVISPMGGNLFSALNQFTSEKLKKSNPFEKTRLVKFKKQLEEWAKKNDIELQTQTPQMKTRSKAVVANTFYQCGMVVPYDKKTKVGYREIPESNTNLKKIFKKIVESKSEEELNKNFDPLQELVTNVQYANDEVDYGMGLELGLDLLAYGGEAFHSTIEHLLCVAYELLERGEFAIILKAHLKNRRKLAE